jgi:hypothetical protein
MKNISRLMLLPLGIGILAVVVSFLSRHTFASEPPPTQLTPPSSLVTLSTQPAGMGEAMFFLYNPATGQYASGPFALPSGMSLVVTDIVWGAVGCTPGSNVYAALVTSASGYTAPFPVPAAYTRIQTVDSTGNLSSTDHFNTGIVFTGPYTPISNVIGSCSEYYLTVEGFGSPGPPTAPPLQ